MRKHLLRFLLLCLVSNAVAPSLFAADRFHFVLEKTEEKQKNRWSLSEWLDTRDRMRMMDLWLALHSPTPYEFYVSGVYRTGSLDSGPSVTGWDLVVAGYAYLFGLEVQKHWLSANEGKNLYLLNFRVFGYHNQATNLTLQGGLSNEMRGAIDNWNAVVGAHLTLYIAKGFGIAGLYRHRFGRQQGGLLASGKRLEAGAFIDFKFLRFFADYFSEKDDLSPAFSYQGLGAGARVYF